MNRGKLATYIVLGLVVVALLILGGRQAAAYVPQFAAWVEGLGVWGPLVFILGYAVATVAFIPGSVLTLAAGAIFGVLEGTLYTLVGATLGATPSSAETDRHARRFSRLPDRALSRPRRHRAPDYGQSALRSYRPRGRQ